MTRIENDMDDIKDVKPPINVPLDAADFLWWIVIAAVCVAAAIAYLLYKRFASAHKTSVPPPAAVPPWDIALEQLKALAAKNYLGQGLAKTYYIELCGIARHYLENRFHIRAPEMTTEEFLNYAQASGSLAEEHRALLGRFLQGCDMIKFAKHQPSIHDAHADFERVERLIKETRE